jgi:hypothetical protein
MTEPFIFFMILFFLYLIILLFLLHQPLFYLTTNFTDKILFPVAMKQFICI